MSDEKKTTAAAKKAAEVQEEAVVYCGPTIKGLAPQYTVFVGGVPTKLAEKMEAIPVLKALTVPREKFAEMRVQRACQRLHRSFPQRMLPSMLERLPSRIPSTT